MVALALPHLPVPEKVRMNATEASQSTSLSLLDGIRERDPDKWNRFANIYGPLLYSWCRRGGVPEQDAADVSQEVFRAVAAGIQSFRREQAGDSFRGWLWGICRNKIKDHFRYRGRHPDAVGGSQIADQAQQIADGLPETWSESDLQQDSQVLFHRALALIQDEFESRTWQAFWRIVVEDRSAGEVADELGMTLGSVHNAKYKVLRRLRLEFDGLL
jgi:RNA polymerase sigma-70 factor, ECF subfamily